jgi:hypothetical protein
MFYALATGGLVGLKMVCQRERGTKGTQGTAAQRLRIDMMTDMMTDIKSDTRFENVYNLPFTNY